MAAEPALLSLTGVEKRFAIGSAGGIRRAHQAVRAVDGVDLDLERSRTLGLVGESGCGKSTLARLIVRLEDPDGGVALFEGHDVFGLRNDGLRRYRRDVQMIFQDPYSSLNPRQTVGDAVMRAWRIHRDVVPKHEQRERCAELIDLVGIRADRINWYPHQLSGGQRQRVGIARAIALDPKLVVCDEPVSALDVSVQAKVLDLLTDLQSRLGMSYLFISHDLSVVREVAQRVAVMYLGRIVELADTDELYTRPAHPYTQALMAAAPIADPAKRARRTRQLLQGDPPSPVDLPSGCRFRTRCPKAQPVCAERDPALELVSGSGHRAACHFPDA